MRDLSNELLAISFEEEGIAIAHTEFRSAGKPILKACYFLASKDFAQLSEFLQKHSFKKIPCILVLPSKSYELCLIEPPPVEAGEMLAALQWHIKGVLTFPVEESVFDYVQLYDKPPAGRPNFIYVVAGQKKLIQPAVELVQQHHLKLSFIDVRELVLAYLLPSLGLPQESSLAFLNLQNNTGFITIYQKGTLFLARELAAGTEAWTSNGDSSHLENLVLEIQRSLDYYESNFGQKPVTQVLLTPCSIEVNDFSKELSTRLGVPIKTFDLSEMVEAKEDLPRELQACCLFAVAAALRSKIEHLEHETAN